MSVMTIIQTIDLERNFDVIVCGGGPAGIAAAVSAARLNMNVCIIEQMGCFGGIGTSGLVQFFAPFSDGETILAGNFGKEAVERLRHKGGTSPDDKPDNWDWIPFNNEVLKLVYDEMAEESGVTVKFFSTVVDVQTEEGRISSVLVSGGKGIQLLKANVIVDTTGDGFVSFLAGAPFRYGDEDERTQASTLCSIYSNVDWDTHFEFLKETGQGADLPIP
jgi:flavin-dependent dehydrogenase